MPHQKRTATGVLGGLLGLVGLSAIAGLLVTATVTPAIAVSGYAASSVITVFDKMPSYLEIDDLMLPSEFYATADDGTEVLLAEFYDQNRIPVTFDEVAPVMYDAMLSSEDKNFYSHGGVDLVGTLGAVVSNLRGNDVRGGSSITQQYVKNVLQQRCEKTAKTAEQSLACFNETTVSDGSDGIERKVQEMRYAIQLEKLYPKKDILLGYLNIAHFGGTTYGIGAAAQRYFGVDAKDLTIGQAAAIAGMVQEPNTFKIDRTEGTNSLEDGFSLTKERQVYVLGRMLDDGKITQEEYDLAVAEPITPNLTNRPQGCVQAVGAEFFCDYVRAVIQNDTTFGETEDDRIMTLRRGGLKVYTTLDLDLQAKADEMLQMVEPSVDFMNLGGSGIQVEVGTGRVLSMAQNRHYDPAATEPNAPYTAVNYNVRSREGGGGHQAGSTYKVFTLLNWLESGRSVNETLNGRLGQKKVLTCDGATQTVTAGNRPGANQIANFENDPGYVGSPYRFTTDSLNSGYLAMAEKVSVCDTNRIAMKLGVMRGNGDPLDNLNVAYDILGSAAVAPIDLAGAYAAIASGGIYCTPVAIDRIVDSDGAEVPVPQANCERVLSEAVANTAAYTLENVINGTATAARSYDGVPIFGKTGIHEWIQTWMAGSSSEVSTIVWVGNVIGDVELYPYYMSGWQMSRLRMPIFRDMQSAANLKYGGNAFPRPDENLTKVTYVNLPDVVGRSVDEARGILEEAGFSVRVGEPVDSTAPEGTVVGQDPGAGRVVSGSIVTLSPSNGQGLTVPRVDGDVEAAAAQLRSAGFTQVDLVCTENPRGGEDGRVTGTDPAAGSDVSRSTPIQLLFERETC